MTGPRVVLDACVLANFSLCDTLLRLAEPPRLFEPKWSEETNGAGDPELALADVAQSADHARGR